MPYYETDELLSQYLHFHYGPGSLGVSNFPRACVELALERHSGERSRALDVGCATGRSGFELARCFEQVEGVDLSQAFIGAANALREAGEIAWAITDEGTLTDRYEASLKELGLLSPFSELTFNVADAQQLGDERRGYDLICAFNLLCRLPEPATFLSGLAARIVPGGTLAISTPATWLENFTPREHWLGGYEQDGRAVRTLEGIQEALGKDFELIDDPQDVEFVIRETSRKHQHTLAEFSAWRRV